VDVKVLITAVVFPYLAIQMRKAKRLLAGLSWLMVIVAAARPMLAQSEPARLQGTITDQSGTLVPEAKVKPTEVSTNRVLESPSPETGTGLFLVLAG
jgi:hypothetical protein